MVKDTAARGLNKYSGKAINRVQGGKRVVKVAKKTGTKGREARFYPAEDVPFPLRSARVARAARRGARLRESITPGTVLILLSGRYRGKRVIFLKQLGSGALLVTGPFKVNGVPVRRVNQAYVIATSTKVDVSGVNTSKFDDSYFARVESADSKGEDGFFATEDSKAVCSDERKKDQKAVDGAIKLSADLKAYLGARFSLKAGDKPHEMNF